MSLFPSKQCKAARTHFEISHLRNHPSILLHIWAQLLLMIPPVILYHHHCIQSWPVAAFPLICSSSPIPIPKSTMQSYTHFEISYLHNHPSILLQYWAQMLLMIPPVILYPNHGLSLPSPSFADLHQFLFPSKQCKADIISPQPPIQLAPILSSDNAHDPPCHSLSSLLRPIMACRHRPLHL